MNIDIKTLKAAALAATQGKWEVTDTCSDYNFKVVRIGNRCIDIGSEENAAYIAAANPAAILSLIAAVESAAAPQPAQASLIDAINDLMDFAPCKRAQPDGMTRGGPYVRKADVLNILAASQQPAAEQAISMPHGFIEAAKDFAKAHIACDENEARYDADPKSVTQEESDTTDAAYNRAKAALVAAYRAASQQPAAAPVQAAVVPDGEWQRAQAICDMPAVDEAIRGFTEDSTGDNATMIVREVMRALAAPAAPSQSKNAQPSIVLPSCGKPLCSENDHHPLCSQHTAPSPAPVQPADAAPVEAVTDTDILMLYAVAGEMHRNESPRCASDLMNLAKRLELMKNPVDAAPSQAHAMPVKTDEDRYWEMQNIADERRAQAQQVAEAVQEADNTSAWTALQEILESPVTSDNAEAFRLKMIAVDAFTGRTQPTAQAAPAQQSGGDSLLKQFLKAGEDAGIAHLNLNRLAAAPSPEAQGE